MISDINSMINQLEYFKRELKTVLYLNDYDTSHPEVINLTNHIQYLEYEIEKEFLPKGDSA